MSNVFKAYNRYIGVMVLFFVLCCAPVVGHAYESVQGFVSEIVVQEDGSFLVTETVQYDFSQNERHGIFRTLPLTHPQSASKWYLRRVVDIDAIHVTLDDQSVPFEITRNSDSLQIKIGDAEQSITGMHRYELSYVVHGGLSYYADSYPELYWNVTGHEWSVPIIGVVANVSAPADGLRPEHACYRGFVGQTHSCVIEVATSTEVVTFKTSELAPGEGLTIAQSVSGQVVHTLVVEEVRWAILLIPALLMAVLLFGVTAYRIKTAHKLDLPVVAQYEPYPGVLPMFTGVLMDGRLDARDITAGIVYLAEQGFLRIKKIDKKVLFLFEVDDYEVTLLKSINEAPTSFHETILSLLFSFGRPDETVTLSDLKSDYAKRRTNQKALMELRKAVADDVVERGFYETVFKVMYIVWWAVGTGVLLAGGYYVSATFLPFVLAVSVVAFLLIAMMYRRRTRLGYEAKNHLDGFKEFLSVTDKERFSFHNAPEKSPEQFLKYLPYAIALGVEDRWAKVFADITIPAPVWYDGDSVGSFSAVALSHDIGAFSTALTTSASSTPSSGGGSAGGGAGGGGGGSW